MTQLVTIHGVRGFTDEKGTAHLNLEDVARGLGFTDNSKNSEYVRWNTVKAYLVGFGFSQEVAKDTFITENFFYRLAMKAKNAAAETFQAKVADEILPSIRRTGMYATAELLDNPDLLIEAATRLKKEREERLKLQAKIEQDKPKVVFAEALEVSKDSILIADLAKLLKQNGFEIGEIRLFEWLRQNGYLIKTGSERNMPTQRSMELKIMEIKIGQRMSASEGSKITRTPKITVKGQSYFINKFKEGA